ncbi:MAG TPA: putative Ig domain-containing protein [Candidatus Acidoferrum sp.]|jgi:hypothetical protein|nr:putative Ig domain-containing protein [Candidatus Acidoferrum sp.]
MLIRPVVSGAWVAGFVLLLAGCVPTTSTVTISPEVSPSTAAGSPTASPSPTPTGSDSSPPVASPPVATPSAAAALRVASLPFHSGEVGIAYPVVFFTATGGTPPYQWALSAGTLPSGLSLSSAGQVSGTPSAPGHPTLTAQVTDSAGHKATGLGSLRVYSALAVTQPCSQQCTLEEGCSVCGAFGGVNGGLGPYHYTVTTDNRPTGMGLSGLRLTGTVPPPGALGAFSMTVQVSDTFGAKRTVNAYWYVVSHISLSSGTCVGGDPTGCTANLPISGGNGTATVMLISEAVNPNRGCWPSTTTPPKGYTLTVNGGNVTVSIPPGIASGYAAVWTLVVTDHSLCGPGTSLCASKSATVTIGVQCS